jgi:hypothetical protein
MDTGRAWYGVGGLRMVSTGHLDQETIHTSGVHYSTMVLLMVLLTGLGDRYDLIRRIGRDQGTVLRMDIGKRDYLSH